MIIMPYAGLRSIPRLNVSYEAAEIDRPSENGGSSGRSPCRWSASTFLCWPVAVPGHRELTRCSTYGWFRSDRRGAGSVDGAHVLTSKLEAFEKWRTGYASAYAIILFVTVFDSPRST